MWGATEQLKHTMGAARGAAGRSSIFGDTIRALQALSSRGRGAAANPITQVGPIGRESYASQSLASGAGIDGCL